MTEVNPQMVGAGRMITQFLYIIGHNYRKKIKPRSKVKMPEIKCDCQEIR